MEVHGVCLGCKRSADANLRCIMRMKFNALKFCAIILCNWRSREIKRQNGEILSANFTRARIYCAKFHAIAKFESIILSGF